jgi:hypothetical protein
MLPQLLLKVSPTLKVFDQDKTTLITPHGIYCYMTMTFGLRNAGATYQKAIQKCLVSQIDDNVEAYIDDVVVKTIMDENLIADTAQTFTNLRHYCWKLNPEKCVFGVPSDKLLGFMVSHWGIEANPTKVDAIWRMKRPTRKKDVMKLTNMMAALGRFITKLGEKGLPFFKLMKKADKFVWTKEADQALEKLKTFLTMPLVMVPPAPKERCCSTSLRPLWWLAQFWWHSDLKKANLTRSSDPSTMLVRSFQIARLDTQPQKMLYALLVNSHKLLHCFHTHKIKVVSAFPLGEILRSHDTTTHIVKWSIEQGEFDLEFCPRQAIKS